MRVFAATLLAVLTLAFPAAAVADRDREIDVATYNIHHAADVNEQLSLERIAAEIDATGAEVAGLQEVDRHWSARSEFVDQAQWLAKRVRMHVVYGANLDLDPPTAGAPRRQYGTAILSEFPIRE
jgi:endonuclease/exonuclease/phosphatase family metal-dependent hydrolase